jgi:hypothetical protein
LPSLAHAKVNLGKNSSIPRNDTAIGAVINGLWSTEATDDAVPVRKIASWSHLIVTSVDERTESAHSSQRYSGSPSGPITSHFDDWAFCGPGRLCADARSPAGHTTASPRPDVLTAGQEQQTYTGHEAGHHEPPDEQAPRGPAQRLASTSRLIGLGHRQSRRHLNVASTMLAARSARSQSGPSAEEVILTSMTATVALSATPRKTLQEPYLEIISSVARITGQPSTLSVVH